MKKAIVLLMTIGFIAIISALVLISLSISKKSFDQVVYLDARNQFSVVFRDFVSMLKEKAPKIEDRAGLDMFLAYSNFATVEPKTEVEIGLFTEYPMGKLNLNFILDQIKLDVNNTKTLYLERPLLKYFESYELKEPQILLDILNDTMDESKGDEYDPERGAYTEIAAEDFDFRQGHIYSFNHLKKIFDRYYKVSYDPNIYRITKENWEEIFYFGETNSSLQFLDCLELEGGVTFGLITDGFISTNICDDVNKSQDADFKRVVDIYNIEPFNKNSQYFIKCSIIFNTDNYKRNVTFDYNVKNQEIKNIDKNFQE